MKRLFTLVLFCAICASATAVSYQAKNDFLYYRNYYNPSTRSNSEGIYLHGYGMYTLNMPLLSGKEPLDIECNIMAARKNYSIFGSIQHSEYSYFCGVCLTAGGSYTWSFNDGDHKLSAGGRLLVGLNSVDFTILNYDIPHRDPASKMEDYRARILPTPDIDLGVEYCYKHFHLGFSVKNAIGYKAKYQDICYVSWPRSFMLTLHGDPSFAEDRVKLEPLLAIGLNQNIYFMAGMDFTLWKNYRVGYSFRGPDLFHNVHASVNIVNRVELNIGYSITPSHRYSMVHAGITVRLAD